MAGVLEAVVPAPEQVPYELFRRPPQAISSGGTTNWAMLRGLMAGCSSGLYSGQFKALLGFGP